MNNILFLKSISLSIIILGMMCGYVLADTEKKAPEPEESIEAMLDSLTDPFISKLPKVEIPQPTPLPTPINSVPIPTPIMPRPIPTPSPIQSGLRPPISLPTPQPFQNIGTPKPDPAANFSLTGIIYNTAKPQAIINGSIVTIGDSIGSAVVKDIKKGYVDLQYDKEIIKLEMKKAKSDPKQKSGNRTMPGWTSPR